LNIGRGQIRSTRLFNTTPELWLGLQQPMRNIWRQGPLLANDLVTVRLETPGKVPSLSRVSFIGIT